MLSDARLMSPRDFYWFLAGALVSLTAAFTLRSSPASQSSPPASPIAGIAATTPLDDTDVRAAELISQPEGHADTSRSAGSLEEVTRRLAARLASAGGTSEEWRLLAQSYDYLGRTQEAQA